MLQWNNRRKYFVSDMCIFDTMTYLCNATHLASIDFESDKDKWDPTSAKSDSPSIIVSSEEPPENPDIPNNTLYFKYKV